MCASEGHRVPVWHMACCILNREKEKRRRRALWPTTYTETWEWYWSFYPALWNKASNDISQNIEVFLTCILLEYYYLQYIYFTVLSIELVNQKRKEKTFRTRNEKFITCHGKTQAMKFKELSVDLHDNIFGSGYKSISKALSLPRGTVASIILKLEKIGTPKTLPRVGWSAKLSNQTRGTSVREVIRYPTTWQMDNPH